MTLLFQLARQHYKALLVIVLLSMVSACLSIGVIAFIQYRLLDSNLDINRAIWQFSGLLVLLLASATCAQVSLHRLGHKFVYDKRCQLVKQLINTDIEQIESLGSAGILASLNTDIRNVTIAFVALPGMIYGLIVTLVALCYLIFLSPPLFAISVLVLAITGVIGYGLVSRITHHVRQVRDMEDKLYQDYQAIIQGSKELSLNPQRARRYFRDEFRLHAQGYRRHVTQADTFNSFAANLANTIVLALIGLNFYLALGFGWASFEVASTFALVILFIRMPLMAAVGALPGLVSANISMTKLDSLALNRDDSLPMTPPTTELFRRLELRQVTYQYSSQNDEAPFQVGPLDFSSSQGEVVFVIGGNGSGKSTFAQLLTGLYRPHSGQILLNGKRVEEASITDYRQQFSAVFSDFYLFPHLVDGQGTDADDSLVSEWMQRLEMSNKVSVENGRLSDTRYSQGQRKRLALLMAIAEKKGCLLLDEWAADQDPRFRHIFYHQLLPLLKQRNITVIAITHDDRYFTMADRILKMESGQLSEFNPSEMKKVSQAFERVLA